MPQVRQSGMPKRLILVLILTAVACGCIIRLSGPCQMGSAAPSLDLVPGYLDSHPGITIIRLCVRGGSCATRQVDALSGATRHGPPAPSAAPVRVAAARDMSFGRLIPAAAARLGPAGPPVHLQLTAYAGARVILSASASLGPLTEIPPDRCRPRGYYIQAWLTPSGTLTYYPAA